MRVVASVLAVVMVVAAGAAAAQEPTPRERRLGREQFNTGVQHAQAGEWDQARDAFQRAYELTRRPAILINLAAAQVQLGQLVDGAETYREYLRAEGEEESRRRAAQQALVEVERRIAHVQVLIEGVEEGDAVALDGEGLPAAAIGTEVPVDPGAHEITVTRDGEVVARGSVTVGEGETRAIELRAAGRATVVEAPVERERGPLEGGDETADDDEGGGSVLVLASPWFWLVVGAVAIGGGAAVYFGTRDGDPATPDGYQGTIGRFRTDGGYSGTSGQPASSATKAAAAPIRIGSESTRTSGS